MANEKASWHFIGHLQTNKVKQAVGKFSLIHSVDSLRLAQEISRMAQIKQITQPILLQVKLSADPSKSGFTPEELKAHLPEIIKLPNIECRGLMTITPKDASGEIRHKCFTGLKQLRDELEKEAGIKLTELSMGMSDDWQEALACGSTMLRIGYCYFPCIVLKRQIKFLTGIVVIGKGIRDFKIKEGI